MKESEHPKLLHKRMQTGGKISNKVLKFIAETRVWTKDAVKCANDINVKANKIDSLLKQTNNQEQVYVNVVKQIVNLEDKIRNEDDNKKKKKLEGEHKKSDKLATAILKNLNDSMNVKMSAEILAVEKESQSLGYILAPRK
jgi:hypothetical protein